MRSHFIDVFPLSVQCLKTALIALVVADVLWSHLKCIAVKPLEEVHVVLKSALCHLLERKHLLHFELNEGFVENLQVSRAFIVVASIQVKSGEIDGAVVQGVDDLAVANTVCAQLHLAVVAVGEFVEPLKQLQTSLRCHLNCL